MAYHLEFSKRADRNLDRIFANIGADSIEAAARWAARLEYFIGILADTPFAGAITHENPATRQLIFGNKPHFYRVVYRVDEKWRRVIVLHITHGRRTR